MVSLRRRGGPKGSNVSFNHGAHPAFGAVGHWGAPDIGWNGTEEAAVWSHVVYTQDGNETRVYTNGVLADSESPITLATHIAVRALLLVLNGKVMGSLRIKVC
ncbi:MAG: hypothetical protein GWQ08_27735 [Verrucomicrobiaceae bacterium]|nr:hypothetical protein [Verrucomicrobiaceae bacterium]